MADLDFAVTGADADRSAAAPAIALHLRVTSQDENPVQALALRAQVRIEPGRRGYGDDEADAMRDLFGERARWRDTLKPLQLAFVSLVVPGFAREAEFDLSLPCSYDFDVAANKYLYALDSGEIPLLLLFSGMAFTSGPNGFGVSPVPWDREARFRLPVEVWRTTMDLHFPGAAWLRLGTDTFDALYRYRVRRQLIDWDDVVTHLLKDAGT